MSSVTNIIAGLTAFQLLYFSGFLFLTKRGKRENKLLLSAFLFANALFILDYLLRSYSSLFLSSASFLFKLGYNFGFLFGPLLYLYTRSLVFKNFRVRKNDLLHFIPFILFFIFFFLTFHIKSPELQREVLLQKSLYPKWFNAAYVGIMNIQILVYMAFCIRLLGKYSQEIKHHYSTIGRQNLSWLRVIVYAFFFMWMIDLTMFLLAIFEVNAARFVEFATLLSLSINFVFANYIIYKGLENPELYSGIEEIEEAKYSKSGLTEDEKVQIRLKIENYLNESEAFLNPNLTLSELADAIDINPKYVSQVINEKLGRNFYDLINSFRIEYAKKIMSDEDDKITILEVLYSSGFNSKSVFNTVFKKATGMTPTQYKKSA